MNAMKSTITAIGLAALLTSGPCHSARCGVPGSLNVNKSANGSAFIFYPSRSYGDSRFVLPGKEFQKDLSAPPGKVQFFVDGIHYEFLTTPKAQFVVESEIADDATVLARHTAYERKYILKVAKTGKEFHEIGSRQRPPVEGTPALLFRLWQMTVSKKKGDPSQYFLTTVIGDDVAMLSAIVGNGKDEVQALRALDSFAQTFKFLLSEESCPPT